MINFDLRILKILFIYIKFIFLTNIYSKLISNSKIMKSHLKYLNKSRLTPYINEIDS